MEPAVSPPSSPPKPVSLVRTALWSSLGIENVIVVALIYLKTQPDLFHPMGATTDPAWVAQMESVLANLRWTLLIPWLILANGLGIAVRAYLLWRTNRATHYRWLTWGSATIALAGFFASDWALASNRWRYYPEVFQGQIGSTANSCMMPDILIQWGEEGCGYLLDRFRDKNDPTRRRAAVVALGYVDCPHRETLLRDMMKNPQEAFSDRVNAASALDWLSEGRLRPELDAYVEELIQHQEYALGATMRTYLTYHDNHRKKPFQVDEFLFPSACNAIVSDEQLVQLLGKPPAPGAPQ